MLLGSIAMNRSSCYLNWSSMFTVEQVELHGVHPERPIFSSLPVRDLAHADTDLKRDVFEGE